MNGDGKADICGRNNTVYKCHLSRGTSFGPAINGPELSNESTWDEHDHYSTIRFADVDGDGDNDLCARAKSGFRCWKWRGTDFGESGFSTGMLTDAAEWDVPRYYRTIRMTDVDGDGKADLCARSREGLKCWISTGGDFTRLVRGPEWSDDRAWNEEAYGSTIRASSR